MFLAFTPIIMCKLSYDLVPKWLEDNHEILNKYHNKFCDALTISGICQNDYKMVRFCRVFEVIYVSTEIVVEAGDFLIEILLPESCRKKISADI